MKNIIYICLLVFASYSCGNNKDNNQSISFNSIDVTIFNGWTDVYSLKLFDTGKMYIQIDKYKGENFYYALLIQGEELDSISRMTKKILISNVDSIYKESCEDCGYYNLIIKSNDKCVSSFVDDIHNKNTQVMNELVFYLESIANMSQKSIDSTFYFESKTKVFTFPSLTLR